MYIYESHMGGLYTLDEPLDYEDLYCEECGDSDWLIGYAETREEAWNLLKDMALYWLLGDFVYCVVFIWNIILNFLSFVE